MGQGRGALNVDVHPEPAGVILIFGPHPPEVHTHPVLSGKGLSGAAAAGICALYTLDVQENKSGCNSPCSTWRWCQRQFDVTAMSTSTSLFV